MFYVKKLHVWSNVSQQLIGLSKAILKYITMNLIYKKTLGTAGHISNQCWPGIPRHVHIHFQRSSTLCCRTVPEYQFCQIEVM